MALTGLSRSTVNQRMDALIETDLLTPVGAGNSTGGRRPSRFAFHAGGRHILTAQIGASGLRVTLSDLTATILFERFADLAVTSGPEVVLVQVETFFDELLAARAVRVPVAGIGIAVPGPVETGSSRVVSPPIMPGWAGYDIAGRFAHYDVPVLIDNDANAMALGEQRMLYPEARNLLMIKASTGIGSGIVLGGHVIHGAEGGAGDIGHITVAGADTDTANPPTCKCGRQGCAEAYAGGWALMRDMNAEGRQLRDLQEFVDLVRVGDPLAVRLAMRASRIIGDLVAGAVNLLNPSHVVIGGMLVQAEETLLSGIRQAVYNRCMPLSTRTIRIEASRLAPHAGNIGLSLMCADTAIEATGDLAIREGRLARVEAIS